MVVRVEVHGGLLLVAERIRSDKATAPTCWRRATGGLIDRVVAVGRRPSAITPGRFPSSFPLQLPPTTFSRPEGDRSRSRARPRLAWWGWQTGPRSSGKIRWYLSLL